jgi:adenosylcobinamide-GDP ribazoletransferase
MPDAGPPPLPEERGLRLPGIDAFAAAFRSLTVLGCRKRDSAIDGAAVYYPLVGLLLGVLWLAVDRLAAPLGRVPSSLSVLAVALLSTGGAPLRDLASTVAAALTPTRSAAVTVMESRSGALVCLAAVVIALVELACFLALDRFRTVALIFVPMLGRSAMVVLAVGSRAAREDQRQVKFAPGLGFNEFALASTIAFALIFLSTEFLGLLLVLGTAGLTVGLRVLFHRWLGGINMTATGAACEATQLMGLVLLAAFR